MSINYRQKIENSRVYDVAKITPLEFQPNLSARIGNRVLLKREDMQPVFSFKLRGAYNKMVNLAPEVLKRGVIAASAGNHAQGVALAAQKLNCRAVIVMPTTTPLIKINAVKSRGAEVILFGDSYSDAYVKALELEKTEKLSPNKITSAPRLLTALILMSGVVVGITITARQLSFCAASATPCAWLPALAAITPRFNASGAKFTILLYAPRSLNENTGCMSSRLSNTRLPMRADKFG